MIPQKPPLILAGQVYLNDELNEYLIVTKSNRGQINYRGNGFCGQFEDHEFIEKFEPVNPVDIDEDELKDLLFMCPDGTEAKIGFIMEE